MLPRMAQKDFVNVSVRVLSHFSHVLLFSQPLGCSHGQLLCPWDSPGKDTGLPCLPPGDLPDPGFELMSVTSPELAGASFTTSTTWEALKVLVASVMSNPL